MSATHLLWEPQCEIWVIALRTANKERQKRKQHKKLHWLVLCRIWYRLNIFLFFSSIYCRCFFTGNQIKRKMLYKRICFSHSTLSKPDVLFGNKSSFGKMNGKTWHKVRQFVIITLAIFSTWRYNLVRQIETYICWEL